MKEHYYSETTDAKSEPKKFKTILADQEFVFKTDNAVFSKDYLDFGSRLLIETFDGKSGSLLDLGSGYGPIGVILGKLNRDLDVTMVDINERAIELAKENCRINDINAKVLKDFSGKGITDRFDYVLTNPPIRAGKQVVFEFYDTAYRVLEKGGELWVVIQKKQGAESSKKYLEEKFSVSIKELKKGYVIFCCKKNV